MKRLLFVCIENSNRSQMAQAFARIYGSDKVEAYSAGSRPSRVVNPKAVTAMAELDYDLSKHNSTSIDDIPEGEYEYVVTMGCGDECPWVPAKHHIDWEIPDPRNMEGDDFNSIRDLVGTKVKELIDELT